MFHQGRVRPRHRQSRGTWRRRCWLRCETRLAAVTCYGAPSTSDLRPCAMTKATSCTLARCPPHTWKRQCQTPPSTRSCQASTPRHVRNEVKRGLRLHRKSCMKLDLTLQGGATDAPSAQQGLHPGGQGSPRRHRSQQSSGSSVRRESCASGGGNGEHGACLEPMNL